MQQLDKQLMALAMKEYAMNSLEADITNYAIAATKFWEPTLTEYGVSGPTMTLTFFEYPYKHKSAWQRM